MGTYWCHLCGAKWRSGELSGCACPQRAINAAKEHPYNESHRTPCAEMVSLLRVTFLRGAGTSDDPVRQVRAYYEQDGTLVCHDDAYPHQAAPKVKL
jgi:hypothetical protein